MYNFILLSRGSVVPPNTLGIEITSPDLAAQCDLGNIDPQHGQDRASDFRDDYGAMAPIGGPGGAQMAVDGGFGPAWLSGYANATAAVDAALEWPLPPDGANIAFERPDVDACAAAAVLVLHAAYESGDIDLGDGQDDPLAELHERVALIARADNFAAGQRPWKPVPLPTEYNPWPAEDAAVADIRPLAALGPICSPRQGQEAYPLSFRVACCIAWLLGGDDPTADDCETAWSMSYASPREDLDLCPGDLDEVALIQTALTAARVAANTHRADMARSLIDGRTTVRVECVCGAGEPICPVVDEQHAACAPRLPASVCESCLARGARRGAMESIALVRSSHATLSVGYAVAPVQIATNPAHQWPSGAVTEKVTIAFWSLPPEKHAALCAELNRLENAARTVRIAAGEAGVSVWKDGGRVIVPFGGSWGGNPKSGIIGSPQGLATLLSEDQILDCVRGVM